MRLAVFRTGFIPLGRWWRVPVSMHWSVPLIAVLLGRFRFVPGLWVGALSLTLIHELGHAWFIRRFRQQVVAIELTPLGGRCLWRGEVTRLRRALIAWGGVLAQAGVLAGTLAVQWRWGPFTNAFASELSKAWIWINLGMLVLNLMPVRPFDGYVSWQIVAMLAHRYQLRKALGRVTDRKLRAIETLAADLEDDRLSPDLKRQLDRLTDEVYAEAERKAELNRS